MSVPEIGAVVDAWALETSALGQLPFINHVQIFENRGAMMGASNPHPHCQIWATEHIPDESLRELAAQQEYHNEHHSCLLCDYLAAELAQPDARIVVENDLFVALVPYWAIWPFETLILPRRHLGDIPSLTPAERTALAEILKAVTTRYDNLFQVPSPTAWASTSVPPTARPTKGCTSTPTFIRHCCAPPRSENSWSASKCSARPSATSLPKPPPPASAPSPTNTTSISISLVVLNAYS